MANTPSNMLALGTRAPFELPNPSHSNEIQSLEDLKGEKGTLVIFMQSLSVLCYTLSIN